VTEIIAMTSALEDAPTKPNVDDKNMSAKGGLESLSVVICTRDRADLLLNCIESVVRQTVRPMELIVVDDGQLSEHSKSSIESRCTSAGIAFCYLQKDEPGLPRSRNLAVKHAGGDIIQFLDDDVTLDADFCSEILHLYAEDTDKVLLGTEGTIDESQTPDPGARVFGWVYRIAGWWSLKPRRRVRLPKPGFLCDRSRAVPSCRIVGATMAFRRSALLDNSFDEALQGYALGEDRDMALRLSRQGWMVRSVRARALHHVEPSGRPDGYAFGQMIVGNYVRIMNRNGFTGVGDRLVISYSLVVIALALLCFSAAVPRRYFPQFLGMIRAGAGLLLNTLLGRVESADGVE